MVEQVNGKSFKLDLASLKNWDAYLIARGTPEAMRKVASNYAVVVTYTVAGDDYTITTAMPGTDRQLTQGFTIGVEADNTARDGIKVKSKWARDGNKLIETQRGESKTFVITHDFSAAAAGTITVTFAVDNVTSVHTYKAI